MKSLLNKYKKLDRNKEAPNDEDRAWKKSKMEGDESKVHVDFLIIGAQKAGTTSLVTNLNKHPDVFVKNECQFFTFCWGFGPSWYREQLRTNKRVVGEKTPELIYCDECAPRIKQVCPEAKFIFCIRDPINRAYSSWNMEVRTDKESLPFEECVERELKESMGAMRTYGTAEYHYIQRGFYMDQLERFHKTFPDKSKILVIVAERLLSHPAEEFSRVVEFLGISNFTFVPEMDNVGDYRDKISEKVKKKLQDIYAPHNKRLFDYLGYSIPEWRTSCPSSDAILGTNDISPCADYVAGNPISTIAQSAKEICDASANDSTTDTIVNHVNNMVASHNGDFARIGAATGTDKIFHHGYHRFYPPFIERFRNLTGGAILEIGVEESKSLKLWLEYFPHAYIYGIDIGVTKSGPRYKIMQADQSKSTEIQQLVRDEIKHPLFFIIDDGSHIPEHQISCFDFFFGDVLLPGGVYIIEDIETSYWTRNGLYGYKTQYGYHHQNSVIEIFKDVLDDIQHEFLNRHARDEQDRRLHGCLSKRTRQEINTITFGQNCVVITKKTEAEHQEFDGRKYRFIKNL